MIKTECYSSKINNNKNERKNRIMMKTTTKQVAKSITAAIKDTFDDGEAQAQRLVEIQDLIVECYEFMTMASLDFDSGIIDIKKAGHIKVIESFLTELEDCEDEIRTSAKEK